jgi:hypothetical protein
MSVWCFFFPRDPPWDDCLQERDYRDNAFQFTMTRLHGPRDCNVRDACMQSPIHQRKRITRATHGVNNQALDPHQRDIYLLDIYTPKFGSAYAARSCPCFSIPKDLHSFLNLCHIRVMPSLSFMGWLSTLFESCEILDMNIENEGNIHSVEGVMCGEYLKVIWRMAQWSPTLCCTYTVGTKPRIKVAMRIDERR